MSDQLHTAREVADRLRVSTETILRWRRRGDLSAIRLPGGAIRFREDELERWLKGRETSQRATASVVIGSTDRGEQDG